LPFTVNDDQLKDIFKDFSVTSAHVEAKESGMSKGYGFVEFETETEQKRALTVMNGIEVEGRAIAVKVARALLTDAEQQEESAE
jgi:RNA recognition motif-containing protein